VYGYIYCLKTNELSNTINSHCESWGAAQHGKKDYFCDVKI